MMYEVAIAGGGISGLALSIDLANRGHRVILIEKGKYPRHKVCGEYLSLESAAYLHHICPSLSKYDLPVIDKFVLTAPGNKTFKTDLPLGGFGISRFLLEHLLYEEALKQKVNVLTEVKVEKFHSSDHYTIICNGKEIKSKLFCNATGKVSNLHKQNGKASPYIAVKYHVKLLRPADTIEIHNFPGGYCGISNIEDNKSCLCYIVNTEKLSAANNSIEKVQQKFLFANEQLKNIFHESEFILEKPLTIGGIHFKLRKEKTNSFSLGDASASVAPVTGNGMSMGLRSAAFLANEIHDVLLKKTEKERAIKNYSVFQKQQFGWKIKLSSTLQSLTESSSMSKLSIQLFNAFPSIAQKLIAQTHGQPF
jgi:menaquinone-9 beta-reductase